MERNLAAERNSEGIHGNTDGEIAMDWHAGLIRTIVAPLWAGWERSAYLRHYRRLQQTQFDSPEMVQARQWAALKAMIEHAYDTVPFYRHRFGQAGMHPQEI